MRLTIAPKRAVELDDPSPKKPFAARQRLRARVHRLDDAVEVIDGGELRRERDVEPDLQRHVPGEWNAQRVRDGGERIERGPWHAGMNLEEVVAGGLLIADHGRDGAWRRRELPLNDGPDVRRRWPNSWPAACCRAAQCSGSEHVAGGGAPASS